MSDPGDDRERDPSDDRRDPADGADHPDGESPSDDRARRASDAADPDAEGADPNPDDSWQGRADRALGRLVDASAGERILISLAALVLSVIVGALVIVVSGWMATCESPFFSLPGVGTFCYDPVSVYWVLFQGAVWPPYNVAITLQETTLLLFTGLSVAVAFRAGMFNIGTQGQLVLGALATALAVLWAAPFVPAGLVGSLVLVPFGLLVGAVVGGAWGAVPGALKAYADANEVITTIMLNFVATGIAFTLVSEIFKDPDTQTIQTRALPEFAQLQPVFFDTTVFSIYALLVGLAFAGAIYWLLNGTAFGYDLRTSGVQPEAAEYGGVDSRRMMVSSMALSGALGGLGGAVYVMMVAGYWQADIPSLGFDGITVSILAGNNPLGVIPAALLFGALKGGSLAIEFQLSVPQQLVGVLRGLVILFVAMPEFFRMAGRRFRFGENRPDVAADGAGQTAGRDDGAGRAVDEDDGTSGAVEQSDDRAGGAVDRDDGGTPDRDDDRGGEDR